MEPPLYQPGRLDHKFLPPDHPDRAEDRAFALGVLSEASRAEGHDIDPQTLAQAVLRLVEAMGGS